MARHCRALPVPCFSDCSKAECDVDKGQPEATRNALKRANFLLEGYFPHMSPYMPLCFGIIERRSNHIAKKWATRGRGFFLFHIFFRIPFFFFFHFSSFLGSVFQSLLAHLGYVIVEVFWPCWVM